MDNPSKTRRKHQNTTGSESGFSDCSNMTLPADSVSPIPADGTSTLQSFLQTWTPEVPEQAEPANPVTIVVNGIEITGYYTTEDALKLKAAFEGNNNCGGPVASMPSMPSMPQLGDVDDRSSSHCQNWLMQHHNAEVNPFKPAVGYEEMEYDITSFKVPSPKKKCSPKDSLVTMADKLKPKLPCLANEKSHVPSIIDSQSGITAVKGIPCEMVLPESPGDDYRSETHLVQPDALLEDPLSSDKESETQSMLAHQVLLEDLQVSESEEDEQSQSQPLRPPMEETTFLDGMKLRINLKKVNSEAKRLTTPRKRTRSWSSLSSTSESMEDEDLPLLSDARLSDSDAIMLSSDEEDDSTFEKELKTEINLEYYLPKREPKALEQEAFIKQERAYMLEYDAWLEQRRLLYEKIVPGVAEQMPTNMQPVVRLERIAFIDEMAIDLVNKTKDKQNCSNPSFSSSSGSSQGKKSDLSSNIVSFEELKSVARDEGEPALCSLLENLDELQFNSSSDGSNSTLEFPNLEAVAGPHTENLLANVGDSIVQSASEKQEIFNQILDAGDQAEKEGGFDCNVELLHTAQEVPVLLVPEEEVHKIVTNELDAAICKIQKENQMLPEEPTLPPQEMKMSYAPPEVEDFIIFPELQPTSETASKLFHINKLQSVSNFMREYEEGVGENDTMPIQEEQTVQMIGEEQRANLNCHDLHLYGKFIRVVSESGENIPEEQPDSDTTKSQEVQPELVPDVDQQEQHTQNEFDSQSVDEEDDCLHVELSEDEEEFM